MSKTVGFGVLVVGVGLLGWWASHSQAHRMQYFITDHAGRIAQRSVHAAMVTVSGRDIRLHGILDSTAEEAALMADLLAVPGQRVVTKDVTILPKASPFDLTVTKSDTLSASGNVPTEAARAALGLGDAAAALTLASGAPEGWADMASAGIKALGPLNFGKMTLVDDQLTVTGEALGPNEAAAAIAALDALPADKVQSQFTLQDDGAPPAYQIDYTAAAGASISGKLPKGLDVAAVASALGLKAVAGEVVQGILDPAGDASALGTIAAWLGRVEDLRLMISPDGNDATATMQTDDDAAELKAALLGAGFTADVVTATPKGNNGDLRSNAATGADQRFMGGFWLDVPQVDLTLAGCKAAADTVLANGKITFLSGSDALDASAVAVINTLASVMVRCNEEAALRAEIGGHTDNTGDAEANLGLSQRRAIVVRKELIARGVPGKALKSIGHGADMPIADNSTEDDRAANRRTTIDWAE